MNDQERFESGIEQIEKKVDEALIEKRDADQRQTHLSEALAAIEGDGKLASLLQRRLSDAESRLNEVEEQIRHYKDVVRRISDEMLALHDRNLHSREVLEQLESIGADVSDGYEVLHRRQLLFDKCREQLRESGVHTRQYSKFLVGVFAGQVFFVALLCHESLVKINYLVNHTHNTSF